jgi:acetolactate synthase-1/2/3 large subunit
VSTQLSPEGRSVAEAVARGLAARGVERVYGLPGEDHMLILSALASEGIAYIGARCENAACIMACAESQASGRPGVALVTMAPGITNAINGIANAYLDQIPLVVLCGQHPTARQSTAIRQYLDNAKVAAGVTKAAFAATSSINHDLARAFAIAESVAPGPVLLEVRDEIARTDASDDLDRWLGATTEAIGEPAVPVDFVARLGAAEHPVVIIGSHGRYHDIADSVSRLATRLRAPVFVTQSAIGRVRPDPWLAGTFLNGNREQQLLGEADAILGIDLRPNEIYNRPWVYAPISAICSTRLEDTYFPTDKRLVGPVASLLASLEAQLEKHPVQSKWMTDDVANYRDGLEHLFFPESDTSALTIPEAIRCVREAVPDDTVVVADAGFGKPILAYLWSAETAPAFFASSGLSTMGYAIPASIGLRLAIPDERKLVAFMGDGSLLMRASEISVAAELGLQCIYVAWMDSSLTQIGVKQRLAGLSEVGTGIARYSCTAIAAAFGATGHDVSTRAELEACLQAALARSSPTLIGVAVDQEHVDEWFGDLRG